MGSRRTPFGRNEPGEQEVRYSLPQASTSVGACARQTLALFPALRALDRSRTAD